MPGGHQEKGKKIGAPGRGRGKEKPKEPNPEEEMKAGERKFATACKEIEERVKKYYDTHQFQDLQEDEDDDEEDLEEEDVLARVYSGYGEKREENRTQQYLQDAFKSGALVCLICIENIKRTEATWSCEECYCSFHMECVNKWAKDSIFQISEAQADDNQRVDKASIPWCCPKCRFQYGQSKIPSKYFCFCGKQMDPKFDPWLIPHSCGERCEKRLKPECGHTCLLLCHPGPCPPCPKMVENQCHCGQMPPQPRRCCSKNWSCGQTCSQMLSCQQHKCEEPCHPGKCKKCPRQSRQNCNCGAETSLRECADPNWQCGKACGKRLNCGHHLCQKICHSGDCGDCPLSGERRCPCGKTQHILPCTQQIPTCGDTCGKLLSCGIHFCAERCHRGACSQCLQFRVKKCRCGSKQKEMACSKELTCEIKCKNLRDCRRHTCNKKCCLGDCPRCEQPCGRTLTCRNHKCESRCHQGPCYPCTVIHTITCRCGKRKIRVPCGREKYTKPPKCSEPCRVPPTCHHPEREFHKCHQGNCPSCRLVCNLKLKCGHVCPAPCHDAVPVKVVDTSRRIGPWEPVAAPRIEIQKKPCPPCMVPVPTTCRGKHETPQWPCSDLRPYSCGRKCGRSLACTNHTCELECHVVDGAPDNTKAGKNCAPCERKCSKARPQGCSHECKKACHPGNCATCHQLTKIKCHCGLTQLFVECEAWNTATTERETLQCCKNQCNKMMSCGHRCTKDCHSGPCSAPQNCKKKVVIRCPCKRQKKDFSCHLVGAGKATLECDDVCALKLKEKEKEQEEQAKKKLEEEQARQKRELELFEKKMDGKKSKKRNRKVTESNNEKSFWNTYKSLFILTATVVVAMSAYIIMGS